MHSHLKAETSYTKYYELFTFLADEALTAQAYYKMYQAFFLEHEIF